MFKNVFPGVAKRYNSGERPCMPVLCFIKKNVALASNTLVEPYAFSICLDLEQIFGTEYAIVNALTR
jgi:hypothetical protein